VECITVTPVNLATWRVGRLSERRSVVVLRKTQGGALGTKALKKKIHGWLKRGSRKKKWKRKLKCSFWTSVIAARITIKTQISEKASGKGVNAVCRVNLTSPNQKRDNKKKESLPGGNSADEKTKYSLKSGSKNRQDNAPITFAKRMK